MTTPQYIETLQERFEEDSAVTTIQWAVNRFGKQLTLASSLGPQSLVITHMMSQITTPDIFVIDTGRLPQETHDLLQRCMDTFDAKYRLVIPDHQKVQDFVIKYGPNAFYESVELRKRCCAVRKLDPLRIALDGYSAWISGVRRSQSIERSETTKIEWDDRFDMFKINPLVDWTGDMVWNYIKNHNIPYNSLHDEGYTSIGCEPCSRPTRHDEDRRAGRWWWEESTKECGLNVITADDQVHLPLDVLNIDGEDL